MAPARSSVNRARRDQPPHASQPQNESTPFEEDNQGDDLFLDPLMGTPLAIYVEKDVENRAEIVELVSVRHFCTDAFKVFHGIPCLVSHEKCFLHAPSCRGVTMVFDLERSQKVD